MCASAAPSLAQWAVDSGEPEISERDQFLRIYDTCFRLSGDRLELLHTEEPEPVWHGILRRGDLGTCPADPKFGKSHFGLCLCQSVVAGIPFLGFPTSAGPCLVIDNETRGNDMLRRCTRISQALGLDWSTIRQSMDFILLRGRPMDIYQIHNLLAKATPPRAYRFVLLDALYQMLPEGVSENDNAQMTQVMACASAIAEYTQAAVFTVLHTSKGTQTGKKVTDVGAGAGSISRACDAHIVLRRHEQRDAAVIEAAIRSQPPLAPFCARFDYPVWRLAPDLNPANTSKNVQCPTLDVFVEALPAEFAKRKDVLESCHQIFGISREVAGMMLAEAKRQQLVEWTEHKGSRPETIRRCTPK